MDDVVSAQALRDSEELHRATLLSMSDAVFITTDDGAFTFVCPNADVIFGYGEDEVRAMGTISRLLGRDLITLEDLAAASEIRNIEHQIETKDGKRRVVLVHVKRVSIKRGTILYVCRDITERKEAEQEMRKLSGRLMDAHEEERRRLSRELHDGVGQRLALISAELGLLQAQLTDAPEVLEHVRRLTAHAEDVGSELHRLSHELHPALLEQLGLAAAIRRLCEEFEGAHHILVHLEIDETPAAMTNDVALALYRIAQEALHNVVRHSGARNATVRLAAEGGDIVLCVVDDGRGFDQSGSESTRGVGLISMGERSRHVAGRLTLTTGIGHGTRVESRVPLC
jgi:PAS domain S-box-containing protein